MNNIKPEVALNAANDTASRICRVCHKVSIISKAQQDFSTLAISMNINLQQSKIYILLHATKLISARAHRFNNHFPGRPELAGCSPPKFSLLTSSRDVLPLGTDQNFFASP